jgi:hypothetical protein
MYMCFIDAGGPVRHLTTIPHKHFARLQGTTQKTVQQTICEDAWQMLDMQKERKPVIDVVINQVMVTCRGSAVAQPNVYLHTDDGTQLPLVTLASASLAWLASPWWCCQLSPSVSFPHLLLLSGSQVLALVPPEF